MILNIATYLTMFLMTSLFLGEFLAFAEISSITVMTENWKDCTEPDGKGLYFDILRRVYPGTKINYKIAPYKRSLHCCKIGKVDMSIGPYKGEVKGVIYPSIHFFSDKTCVAFLNGTIWEGQKSLSGEKVLWLRGYSYEKYINEDMVFFEQDSQKNALKLIRLGLFKFYIGPEVLINEDIDKSFFQIRPLKWIKMYMVFSSSKKGKKLAFLWDKSFKSLLKKGVIKKLFQKYGMESYYRFKMSEL